MDFVLLDIKNFLKKLENGQLEIEAGQWELHKDLTSMKLAMGELKNLKEDVEKMRLNSVQQMSLIKALQEQIETFKQNQNADLPVTISERSVKYEKVYKRPPNRQSSPKGYKKRKSHLIRSEEIIEITSQMSEKSESNQDDIISKAEDGAQNVKDTNRNKRNFIGNSALPYCRKPSQIIPSQIKSDSQYSCLTNNDILQRYLEDSARYRERKGSSLTDLTHNTSNQSMAKNSSDSKKTPFWDGFSSRVASKVENARRLGMKRNSLGAPKEESVVTKSLACPNCSKKFAHKADFLRHENEHRKTKLVRYCKICHKGFRGKERLREHEIVHWATSGNSTGYKCSYCSKICSTPEELTSHLKKCRIIMRHHFKRK